MALYIGGVAVDATAAEIDVLDGLDRGSIIYGNASSVTSILDNGTNGQYLTTDGDDISWGSVGAAAISTSSNADSTTNSVVLYNGTGGTSVDSSGNLTFDGTNLTVTGTLTSGAITSAAAFTLGSASQFKEIVRIANVQTATSTNEGVYPVGSTEEGNWLLLLFGGDAAQYGAWFFYSSNGGGTRSVSEIAGSQSGATWSGDTIQFQHNTGGAARSYLLLYKLNAV